MYFLFLNHDKLLLKCLYEIKRAKIVWTTEEEKMLGACPPIYQNYYKVMVINIFYQSKKDRQIDQ